MLSIVSVETNLKSVSNRRPYIEIKMCDGGWCGCEVPGETGEESGCKKETRQNKMLYMENDRLRWK